MQETVGERAKARAGLKPMLAVALLGVAIAASVEARAGYPEGSLLAEATGSDWLDRFSTQLLGQSRGSTGTLKAQRAAAGATPTVGVEQHWWREISPEIVNPWPTATRSQPTPAEWPTSHVGREALVDPWPASTEDDFDWGPSKSWTPGRRPAVSRSRHPLRASPPQSGSGPLPLPASSTPGRGDRL